MDSFTLGLNWLISVSGGVRKVEDLKLMFLPGQSVPQTSSDACKHKRKEKANIHLLNTPFNIPRNLYSMP